MNIRKSIKDNLGIMKDNIRRFPLSLLSSIIYGLISIYLINRDYEFIMNKNWEEIRQVFFLGTLLFIDLGLWGERKKSRKTSLAINILGLGFLPAYYLISLKLPHYLKTSYFVGLNLAIIIAMFFMGREKKEDYEIYSWEIIKSFLISFLYSAVLYLGLIFIVFTLEQLFSINWGGNIYFKIFIAIVCSFSNLLFIAKLPRGEVDLGNQGLPEIFRSLIKYILIPLASIYSLILYLYFGKILVTREWPKGIISNLVVWYALVGLVIIFFTNKDRDDWMVYFKKYLPKIILPLLSMMFYSIYLRVNQYGFTENRYYLFLGGIYLALSYIYLNIRPGNNYPLAVALAIFVVAGVFGPLSASRVSIKSQNKRLEALISKHSLEMSGEENKEVAREVKEEVSDIIEYIYNHYGIENIDILGGKISKLDELDKVLGFDLIPYYDRQPQTGDDKFFSYYRDQQEEYFRVDDYKYLIRLDNFDNFKKLDLGEYTFEIGENFNIIIDGEKSLNIRLEDLLREKLDQENPSQLSEEDLVFVIDEDPGVKIIIESLSGTINKEDISIHQTKLLVLIK